MDEFRRVKVKVVEDEMVGWGGDKTCFRVSGKMGGVKHEIKEVGKPVGL